MDALVMQMEIERIYWSQMVKKACFCWRKVFFYYS